jgi:hypothetical protein
MKKNAKRSRAQIVKELVPESGRRVNGVTFDGTLVWYANDSHLVGVHPETGEVVRRIEVPATAGTAFDGEHLYQLAKGEIAVVRVIDGTIVRKLPSPAGDRCSGMAWADGFLWVGEWKESKIHKVDAKTGAVVKTLASDRFVTGVSCVDGALWHGVSDDGKSAELRRVDGEGVVEEVIELPEGVHVAGVEGDGKGGFWCGGEAGKLRLVRAGDAA